LFRSILHSLVATSLWVLPAVAQSSDLDDLVQEALEANPSLAVLESRIETYQDRFSYVSAPPDPVLRFDLLNVPLSSFDLARTPMSGKQIALQQSLPFPGSLKAKGIAALEATKAAESRLVDERARITSLVKIAYYDLSFFDKAIRITNENKALTRAILERTLTRYEVGLGRQHDVLRARVALTLLANRLTGYQTSRRLAEVRLNGLLGRTPDSVLETQTQAQIHVHDVDASSSRLFEVSVGNSGSIEELDHLTLEWEARELAARKSALPAFTINLAYRQRSSVPGDPVGGEDFFSAGVGLNIPIFRGRKQLAQASEARATIRWIAARQVEVRQKIATEVERIRVEMDLHKSEHELFRNEILPQTEQALHSVRSAYEADLVEFSALLNAQSTWLDAKLMSFHHSVTHAKLLAELEAVVGTNLQGLSDHIHHNMSKGGKP
jgi:cobalt-zinc-cadmium efflux system outer membrane protein